MTSSSNMTTVDKVARITFVVFVFFMLFMAQIPFAEDTQDLAARPGPSITTKLTYISVFLSSIYCLWKRSHELLAFIREEKFLTLFVAWCMLGPLWAQFPEATMKKSFQSLTAVMAGVSILLNVRSSRDVLTLIFWVLVPYVVTSILVIALVPAAYEPGTIAWRGLASSKNHLGQIALSSILICFFVLRSSPGRQRIFAAVTLALSVVLLAGSRSMTSMMTLAGLTMMGGLCALTRRIMPLRISRAYSILWMVVVITLGIVALHRHPQLLTSITREMGKDPTFTGRTELWEGVWVDAQAHLVQGCGLGGFWMPENPAVLELYEVFVWLPNQAHLGYLDLLNETGLIGVMLLVLMLIRYARKAFQQTRTSIWHWFVLSALITNFQETTLFRPLYLAGTMFTLAYCAFYVDTLRDPETVAEPMDKERYL